MFNPGAAMYKSVCCTSPDQSSSPGDLGLFESAGPKYGLESILAPFVRQAEIFGPANYQVGCKRDCHAANDAKSF